LGPIERWQGRAAARTDFLFKIIERHFYWQFSLVLTKVEKIGHQSSVFNLRPSILITQLNVGEGRLKAVLRVYCQLISFKVEQ
jgi:hypothetical protein